MYIHFGQIRNRINPNIKQSLFHSRSHQYHKTKWSALEHDKRDINSKVTTVRKRGLNLSILPRTELEEMVCDDASMM